MTFRKFIVYFLNILVLLLMIVIFISSLKTSIIQMPFHHRYQYSLIIPEGWGFFTRNPREAQFLLYKISDKNKLDLVSIKNNSSKNLFGLSRFSRRINLELNRLIAKSNEEDWSLSQNVQRCLVKKDSMFLFIDKGDYLLVKEEIIPWAYANDAVKYTPKKEYKKIYLY